MSYGGQILQGLLVLPFTVYHLIDACYRSVQERPAVTEEPQIEIIPYRIPPSTQLIDEGTSAYVQVEGWMETVLDGRPIAEWLRADVTEHIVKTLTAWSETSKNPTPHPPCAIIQHFLDELSTSDLEKPTEFHIGISGSLCYACHRFIKAVHDTLGIKANYRSCAFYLSNPWTAPSGVNAKVLASMKSTVAEEFEILAPEDTGGNGDEVQGGELPQGGSGDEGY